MNLICQYKPHCWQELTTPLQHQNQEASEYWLQHLVDITDNSLNIFKQIKKHSWSSTRFPNQNLRQISQGLHELWLNLQTNMDKQKKKNYCFKYRKFWNFHPELSVRMVLAKNNSIFITETFEFKISNICINLWHSNFNLFKHVLNPNIWLHQINISLYRKNLIHWTEKKKMDFEKINQRSLISRQL